VVDDEPLVRQSLKMLLEHDGHEVCAVDSGEAALEQFAQLAQRKFDLVITDFSMPGMHGDELITRIREINPAQPIVMVTAFVEEYKVFGKASGNVDALLLKHFSFTELRETIEQVLTLEQPEQPSDLLPSASAMSTPDFISPREP